MIRKIDFAEDLVSHLDSEAARMKTSLSGLINMVLSGIYAAPVRPLFGPEETSKEDGEGETEAPLEQESSDKGKSEGDSTARTRTRTLPGTISIESMPDKKGKTKQIIIPAPPEAIDSPELRSALSEFIHHRKKKGTPIDSERAWTLLYNRLKPVGRRHARLALLYAISQRWTGFDVDWLNGKSWATIASELGLSLEAEKPAPSPSDLAARNLSRAIEDARKEIPKLAPAEDGWTSKSRTVFFDHLDACKSEVEVQAHLAACRALCDRLRAMGAFPLRRATQAGEILPAGGGGPLAVDLRGAFVCDSVCPACGEDQVLGTCSCRDLVGGLLEPDLAPDHCRDRLARLRTEIAENERDTCEHGTPYRYPCEECDDNPDFGHGEDMVGDDTSLEKLETERSGADRNPDFCPCGAPMIDDGDGGTTCIEDCRPACRICGCPIDKGAGGGLCAECKAPKLDCNANPPAEAVEAAHSRLVEKGMLSSSKQRAKVADGQHAYAHNALSGKCAWCGQGKNHIRHYLPQELPFTVKEES